MTDFGTWSRTTLEEFAQQAADENKELREQLRTAIDAYRKLIVEGDISGSNT
jgi:hypothetical protein